MQTTSAQSKGTGSSKAVAAGKSNKEIEFSFSSRKATVKTHVESLLNKLGRRNENLRGKAAVRRGLVQMS